MYLYHYYDKDFGPFRCLSELPLEQAKKVLDHIQKTKPNSQHATRDPLYVEHRRNCEAILRREFAKKGGKMERTEPYYMVVEHSPWLSTWFEKCEVLKISVEEFDLNTISFTYGDSMPAFSPTINDGKEYRHKLYTYPEILTLIEKYGLPQNWNNDGAYGPERYIEAQIWSDATVRKYFL